MSLVSSSSTSNNHKLYFSKNELTKILNLYSLGVSRGDWKDYSINFNKNNAFFYIFKHTLASPECILNKCFEKRKRKIFYKLILNNFDKKYDNLDNLIINLKRKNFQLLKNNE